MWAGHTAPFFACRKVKCLPPDTKKAYKVISANGKCIGNVFLIEAHPALHGRKTIELPYRCTLIYVTVWVESSRFDLIVRICAAAVRRISFARCVGSKRFGNTPSDLDGLRDFCSPEQHPQCQRDHDYIKNGLHPLVALL